MIDPRDTVLAFLQAYWRSDTEAATGFLAPGATLRLPRSMCGEGERSVPAAPAITSMIDGMFSRFLPPRGLVIEIRRVAVEGDTVLVEYGGAGTLDTGAEYANDYVVSVTTADGLVAEMRPYGDTRYIQDMFAELAT
jgi:ketosteroid isomerase-like protein